MALFNYRFFHRACHCEAEGIDVGAGVLVGFDVGAGVLVGLIPAVGIDAVAVGAGEVVAAARKVFILS